MSTLASRNYTLRPPVRADGKRIHSLVRDCKPLDENSCYAYLLLCEHFADTCVVAETDDQELAGFISAYIPPAKPDVVFVWQVAVSARARGAVLGGAMLRDLIQRDACRQVRYLETTVSPSNTASQRMFEKFAGNVEAKCLSEPLFDTKDFSEPGHEPETLFRIGPLNVDAP
jgi:L-2,4-diaminobutyric acid acetyltransferase